jgi:hypothetical protein
MGPEGSGLHDGHAPIAALAAARPIAMTEGFHVRALPTNAGHRQSYAFC